MILLIIGLLCEGANEGDGIDAELLELAMESADLDRGTLSDLSCSESIGGVCYDPVTIRRRWSSIQVNK